MTPRAHQKPERRSDALSRERIIEAAIALLDEQGEGGLTFRALSARLATGPGAIYWHVAGKGELLQEATYRMIADAVAVAPVAPVITEMPGRIHTVALGLFDAIAAHPWLAHQLATELSRSPDGPVTTRLLETIGRQVSALGVPASNWFAATTALLHYILGAAGQNAANIERARSLDPAPDHSAYFAAVTRSWSALSPEDFPFITALAEQGLDHDDRAQFLAGLDLIIAGIGAAPRPGS